MSIVKSIHFWSPENLGSASSLLWNTPLLDWQIRSLRTYPSRPEHFLASIVTVLNLTDRSGCTAVVSYPDEWLRYQRDILTLAGSGLPIQIWVQKGQDIPKESTPEMTVSGITWVLVPSKYDEFENLFDDLHKSTILSWNVLLIPSLDSRDPWLSPEDAVSCYLEHLQRPVKKVNEVLTIAELLLSVKNSEQEVYLNPSQSTLEEYWKQERHFHYKLYRFLKKHRDVPWAALFSFAKWTLKSIIQPQAALGFVMGRYQIRARVIRIGVRIYYLSVELLSDCFYFLHRIYFYLYPWLLKPYWVLNYQFKKRIAPLIRPNNET